MILNPKSDPLSGGGQSKEHVFEVSELASLVKKTLEREPGLNKIWIRGETSRVTYHTSGHLYFSLKDKNAVITCVMWKSHVARLRYSLKEGMAVLAFGSVSTYPVRGNYQIVAADIIPEGLGKLQQQIEQLKLKLMDEGLFADERKKQPPFLPRRVGVITSPTSAAFRDVVRVLRHRFSNVDILLAPSQVQGEEAKRSLLVALEEMDKPEWGLDVLLLVRGGGSLEDLMSFNEEEVVRAVAAMRVPVISGVGHEIDFTLVDFAADRRGATPSHAAELSIPDRAQLQERLIQDYGRLRRRYLDRLERLREKVQYLSSHSMLKEPQSYVYELGQKVDDLSGSLKRNLEYRLEHWRSQLQRFEDLPARQRGLLVDKKNRLSVAVEKLEGLSPLNSLRRGYAFVRNDKGEIVTSKEKVSVGEILQVRLVDAQLGCRVEEISQLEPTFWEE